MHIFTFVTPPRLIVHRGGATSGVLAAEAKRLGVRPLIVAGTSLQRSGMLESILKSLESAGLKPAVHLGVPPEPDLDALQAAMDAAVPCDSVIAIGGGSVLDIGKGAAALAGTGRSAREYHRGAAVSDIINRPILAVPTTAGTGSEATWVGVFTDKEQARKASIRGGSMMPGAALLDGELTVSCPPQVTAYSGADAFVQAVEAYTSVGSNPFTDALALPASAMIAENLLRAFQDGNNREAREAMLLGSYMAGAALNTSRLGLVHGLAHPIGAITGAPHGLLCGLLMPAVVRFNASAAASKYETVLRSVTAWQRDAYPDGAAEFLAQQLESQLDAMGVPRRLHEIGVREEHIEAILSESSKSGSTKANPRPVSDADARAVILSCL